MRYMTVHGFHRLQNKGPARLSEPARTDDTCSPSREQY